MMTILGLLIRKFSLNFLRILIILTFLNSNFGQSQPDYNMGLVNGVKINDNIVEFDVTIKSSDTSFTLTSYQCSFSFNREVADGGELTFTYLDGSSQLSNLPTFGIGINTYDGESKLTFASMAGADQITESDLVVGRFRVVNTVPFANVDPNIRFSLKSESEVKLVVYNLLGEMIQELINNKIAAGNHEYTFNSDGLPSGTYVYRLEANNEVISAKKMMLLK